LASPDDSARSPYLAELKVVKKALALALAVAPVKINVGECVGLVLTPRSNNGSVACENMTAPFLEAC